MCSLLIVSRVLGSGITVDWAPTNNNRLHPHIVAYAVDNSLNNSTVRREDWVCRWC